MKPAKLFFQEKLGITYITWKTCILHNAKSEILFSFRVICI